MNTLSAFMSVWLTNTGALRRWNTTGLSGRLVTCRNQAVELVTDLGQASISLVQRYMKIGYNRAARLIERMEAEGIVGPSDGVKPRKILVKKLPK